MATFNQRDLFLNSDDPELPYRRRNDEEKTSVSYGQRKLLLTVLQFITYFWDPIKVPKPICCYAGSAPGLNIEVISELYPEIEFHLYDPNPFKVKKSKMIHLYRQYFTDKDATKWAKRNDILFISDIRTADYTKAKDLDDNENQIMRDMMNQMKWYNIIKPVQAHLKFRLPYTGGSRPSEMEYLDGILFKQPWAPETSTECRLVPYGPDKLKMWNCMKYQSQMFHHNAITRESIKYLSPFSPAGQGYVDEPELMDDYDSLCETQIILDYLQKRGAEINIQNTQSLSRLMTKKLGSVTLKFLRANPRYIKEKNFRSREDNITCKENTLFKDVIH